MLLVWRGKGLWVFIFFCLWLVAGIFGFIFLTDALTSAGTSKSTADATGWNGDTVAYLFFAGVLAMTALSVYVMDLYRRNHPRQIVDPRSQVITFAPNADEFMWLRMAIWPYILLALTLLCVGLAYFGIGLGG